MHKPEWPRHSDGRRMKLGEMSKEQQREQWKFAGQRIQREFEHPLMQEKLSSLMNGENVSQ